MAFDRRRSIGVGGVVGLFARSLALRFAAGRTTVLLFRVFFFVLVDRGSFSLVSITLSHKRGRILTKSSIKYGKHRRLRELTRSDAPHHIRPCACWRIELRCTNTPIRISLRLSRRLYHRHRHHHRRRHPMRSRSTNSTCTSLIPAQVCRIDTDDKRARSLYTKIRSHCASRGDSKRARTGIDLTSRTPFTRRAHLTLRRGCSFFVFD